MNRFTSLVERLRGLTFPESDEGREGVALQPGATPEELAQLEARLKRPLPAELVELARATLGLSAAPDPASPHLELELRPGAVADWSAHGFDGLFRVGGADDTDPLLLEPMGEVARVWKLGEDPRSLTLVAHTLGDYVQRCVEFCEAVAREEPSRAPTEGAVRVRPVTPTALAAEGGSLGQFVAGLPQGAQVFDLREAPCPAELPLPDGFRWLPGAFGREGAIVALVPLGRPPVDADPAEPILARVFSFFSMALYEQAQRELDAGLAALPGNERLLAWVTPLADKRRR